MPDWATIILIAATAGCDVKTARSFFSGDRATRSTTRRRIETALRSLGLEHFRRAA